MMMISLKDIMTIASSVIALCLSLYNFVRSRREATAANIRTIEQKRFDCSIVLVETRAHQRHMKASVEELLLDAHRLANKEVIEMAEKEISAIEEDLKALNSLEKETDDLLKAEVKGNSKELLTIEKLLGTLKRSKAKRLEEQEGTTNRLANLRRLLQVASR